MYFSGVIFLEIKKIGEGCVRIILSKKEGEIYNLKYENFEKEAYTSEKFLTACLILLENMKIIKSSNDVYIEIFEQENQNIIIYISQEIKETNNNYVLYTFKSPDDYFKIESYLKRNKRKAQIYKYQNHYIIIIKDSNLPININKYKIINGRDTQVFKVKEYGTLLCQLP